MPGHYTGGPPSLATLPPSVPSLAGMSAQQDVTQAVARVNERLDQAEALLQQVIDTLGHWLDSHPKLLDPIREFLAERDAPDASA